MIVKYDIFKNFEIPKMTLCNLGSVKKGNILSNTIGIIIDHSAEEVVLNFNSTSELNFRVNKIVRDNANDDKYAQYIYNSLKNRRLIYLDNIGYFMIDSITSGYSDQIYYKDITAKSIDIELSLKSIPYIDGTYRFRTLEADMTESGEEEKGIIDLIADELPLWSIGYIDDEVLVESYQENDGSRRVKYRTFKDIDTNMDCLTFLTNNIQEAFECIVLFDCKERKINIYSKTNYVKKTNVHISKNNFLKSFTTTENADRLYTAINISNDNGVSIASINPTWTNVIYNFDYYKDWMSDKTQAFVDYWTKAVEDNLEAMYEYALKYYQEKEVYDNLILELNKINMQIRVYNSCKRNIEQSETTDSISNYNNIIKKYDGKEISISLEIQETIDAINNLISECKDLYDTKEDEKDSAMSKMNEAWNTLTSIDLTLNRDVINEKWGYGVYEELCSYIFECSYNDEYITITDEMSVKDKVNQMKDLYNRANERLNNISKPIQESEIDVENFIFVPDFSIWGEQLETGCLINVDLDEGDVAELLLSSMTINYDDRSFKLTFGNRLNKTNLKSLYNDVFENISKSANSINYINKCIVPIKEGSLEELKETQDLILGII